MKVDLSLLEGSKARTRNLTAKIVAGEMKVAAGLTKEKLLASFIRNGEEENIAELVGEENIPFFNAVVFVTIANVEASFEGYTLKGTKDLEEINNVEELLDYMSHINAWPANKEWNCRFDSADLYESQTMYEELKNKVARCK